ncbi:MAG: hypothetical protein ACHP84_10080 [Caulobacterales bacterium]
MAAILSVTTVRAHAGKYPDALATFAKLKTHLERLGGKGRIVTQAFGATPLTLTLIVENASWAEFGAMSGKAETDSELQAFLASVRANPIWDIVQRGLSTEVAA